MRRTHIAVIGLVAILLTGTGLLFQYQRVWRWRTLDHNVATLIRLARGGDSVAVGRMTLKPEVGARLLTMARREPAQMDTLLASLTLISAGYLADPPGTVVAHYRTRSTVCGHPDAFDEFQVTAQQVETQWRFAYATITPC